MCILLMGCAPTVPLDESFPVWGGGTLQLARLTEGRKGAVLLFLSPHCPLCRSYALPLNELHAFADSLGYAMAGVLSGTWIADSATHSFAERYHIAYPLLSDTAAVLAGAYGATITPEALVIDTRGRMVYRGAIDNWAISLGQKRQVITERHLRNALLAHHSGIPVQPKTTPAVGCFIE
jgi:peroxiredoxin